MKLAVTLALLASSLALAQPMTPPPPMPGGHGMGGGHMGFGGPALRGIPPQVAQKLGIPPETVKKVDDLIFDANQKLITQEADLRRAQLELEHSLKDEKPNDAQILKLADKVGAAETAVRKNRLQLLLDVRKAIGPELWKKIQAEYGEARELRKLKFKQRWGGDWDDDDDDMGPPQKDQKTPPPPPPPVKK